MNWLKELKHKNWIDWIKILVALDVFSAGIGLILNLNLHVIAPLFGFITRIFMGIFYIMLAVIIIKKVFPKSVDIDEEKALNSKHLNRGIGRFFRHGVFLLKKTFRTAESISNHFLEIIDAWLDHMEDFFSRKKREVKEEVHKTLHKD